MYKKVFIWINNYMILRDLKLSGLHFLVHPHSSNEDAQNGNICIS